MHITATLYIMRHIASTQLVLKQNQQNKKELAILIANRYSDIARVTSPPLYRSPPSSKFA
jgi:hypothetical protein